MKPRIAALLNLLSRPHTVNIKEYIMINMITIPLKDILDK